MSDPLKTSDIEDVLSSIRRLVSEEARPKSASVAPSEPGKLVLTPALRVQEPPSEDETPPSTEVEQEEAAPQDATHGEAPLILGSDIQDDVEPSQPDAQASDTPHQHTDAAALEWEDHDPVSPEPERPEASAASHDPQESETGQETEDHTDTSAAQDWSGTLYEAAGVTSEQAPDAPEIAAAQQPEDDGQFDFLAEDDGLIDEEALRELVSEIVRQELQGALGERITRNVRKLVRREIHRALSAQEFD